MRSTKFLSLAFGSLLLAIIPGLIFGQQKLENKTNPFSEVQQLSAGEYMLHIAELYQKIDSIKNINRLGGYLRETKGQLSEIDTIQHFISQSLTKYSSSLNVRNLQMLDLLLKNAQTELQKENTKLNSTYATLNQLKSELAGLRNDSLIQRLLKDSLALSTVYPQLKELGENYFHTDSVLKSNISKLNTLKVKGSSDEITGLLLITDIQKEMRNAFRRLLSKEENVIWKAEKSSPDLTDRIEGVYQTESKALHYYFKDFNGVLFFLLFFTVLLFVWIRSNLNRVNKANQLQELKSYGVQFLSGNPVVAVIASMLCLAPLFDLNAPATYVEALQFFLLIALTILIYRNWNRDKFKQWLLVVLLYILFITSNHIHDPGTIQRLLMIGLNCLSIYVGLRFAKHIPESLPIRRFTKVIILLFVVMNAFAILLNVFGRFSLSRTFGTTAMFSLTNIIALAVLIQILTETIILQVHAQRIKHGLPTPFAPESIQKSFHIPFLIIAVTLWFIVFTTNLNIYSGIYKGLVFVFQSNISLGSNTISLGSIVLFALIIALAHFMQRNIGFFMGDLGGDDGEVSEQRSRLIMTRLILLISGYLLAIVVSGLPMDQVTIMLGALGVGIGLGLQNIVNNFVSGIILIFDRPLRIGDAIEVGGKEGQIKEIGIRSSTLLTADGAEVIIPNGDILSTQIVNWTHTNPYKRVNLSLKIMTALDKEFLLETINPVIKQQEGILTSRPSTILLESVKLGEYNLKIYIWCSSVVLAEQIKSEMRYALYKAFKEQDILTS